MKGWQGYLAGIGTMILLFTIGSFVLAAPGTIEQESPGVYCYERCFAEERLIEYGTCYTENWPGKHYDWLEGPGGCVVDYDSNTTREEQLDACDSQGKKKEHVADHLDIIVSGEYAAEMDVCERRLNPVVTHSLD